MKKLMARMKSQSGQGMVEYALVLLVVVLIVAAVMMNNGKLREAVSTAFTNTANTVNTASA